jgi:hypothetical protein
MPTKKVEARSCFIRAPLKMLNSVRIRPSSPAQGYSKDRDFFIIVFSLVLVDVPSLRGRLGEP